MIRLAIAALAIAALAGCGGDDDLSCADIDRLTEVYINSPEMTDDAFNASIGADTDAEAEQILAGCPR